MKELTDEQKKELIEIAQELYRELFRHRLNIDPYAREIDIQNFKEACSDMSQLVHYLAKKKYKVPDEDNLIYHCIFCHNGFSRSHMFNKIYNRIVDSTIMQFDNLSPYDNNDKCYTDLRLTEHGYGGIASEIELYEFQQLTEGIYDKAPVKASKKFSFRNLFKR
jgi:hypothetical protein